METKPRGMAACRQRARKDFMSGATISQCPYRARSWQSAWLKELQRLRQSDWVDEVKNENKH